MNLNHFQNTRMELLKLITTRQFPDNRLPSEAELARMMRVSIVTLRQALTMLAAEGYITKRQGLGNFVHRSALNLDMRTDLTYCVENLLKISGYPVEIRPWGLQESAADEDEAQDLQVPPGEPLKEIRLLYLAADRPAALEIHRVPAAHFVRPVPPDTHIGRIDDFLWEYCEKELAHEMTTWVPLLADHPLQTLFGLAPNTPLLGWDQIIYDTRDMGVSHTRTFFNPEIIRPRSLRKWNFGPRLGDG